MKLFTISCENIVFAWLCSPLLWSPCSILTLYFRYWAANVDTACTQSCMKLMPNWLSYRTARCASNYMLLRWRVILFDSSSLLLYVYVTTAHNIKNAYIRSHSHTFSLCFLCKYISNSFNFTFPWAMCCYQHQYIYITIKTFNNFS